MSLFEQSEQSHAITLGFSFLDRCTQPFWTGSWLGDRSEVKSFRDEACIGWKDEGKCRSGLPFYRWTFTELATCHAEKFWYCCTLSNRVKDVVKDVVKNVVKVDKRKGSRREWKERMKLWTLQKSAIEAVLPQMCFRFCTARGWTSRRCHRETCTREHESFKIIFLGKTYNLQSIW